MNKPHKHCELIKAWADGAEIQYRHSSLDWADCDELIGWYKETEYRIKPREFEQYAWYPVMREGVDLILRFQGHHLWNGARGFKPEECSWIGEKLEIDWPEEL